MPALTIDSTTYACRVFEARRVPLSVPARVWDDTLVTSWLADSATVDEFEVEVGTLNESEKNTLVALLEAAGTVDIAGDLPGSTITVKASRIRYQPRQSSSRWLVTFLAEQVTP